RVPRLCCRRERDRRIGCGGRLADRATGARGPPARRDHGALRRRRELDARARPLPAEEDRSMTRPKFVPLVALACAFGVLAFSGVASANPSVLTDPNDATGLDISRVTLAADVPPPAWTIRTFRSWTI